jgi:hypothetical protein
MSFTDDDMKRYKQEFDMDGLSNPVLKALLARLEAAEKAREHHASLCTCDWCITWRKAAGK